MIFNCPICGRILKNFAYEIYECEHRIEKANLSVSHYILANNLGDSYQQDNLTILRNFRINITIIKAKDTEVFRLNHCVADDELKQLAERWSKAIVMM